MLFLICIGLSFAVLTDVVSPLPGSPANMVAGSMVSSMAAVSSVANSFLDSVCFLLFITNSSLFCHFFMSNTFAPVAAKLWFPVVYSNCFCLMASPGTRGTVKEPLCICDSTVLASSSWYRARRLPLAWPLHTGQPHCWLPVRL